MPSIVIKSGGSVLKDNDSFVFLARKIRSVSRHFSQIFVVLSAKYGITDNLLRCTAEKHGADIKRLRRAMKGECNYPEFDNHEIAGSILQGEIDSTNKLHSLIPEAMIHTQENPDFPLVANSSCLNATVDEKKSIKRAGILKKAKINLISGFGAVTKEGKKVTLGRGASDLVAGWIANISGAEKVLFIKDVKGIMRNFGKENSSIVSELGMEEAYELCEGGVLDKRVISLLKGTRKEVIVGHYDQFETLAINRKDEGTRIKM